MKAFSKREKPKESIALTAFMVTLNVILNAANTYLPFIGYFFACFLPLISTIYVLNTKIKYYPIYFIATIALAIASTPLNFSYTLLYLLPSLFCGLMYAACVNKKMEAELSYFYCTVIMFLVEIITIPLIDLIYSTNTIENLLTIFAINNLQYIHLFIYGIIFLANALKEYFAYLVTKDELQKLSYKMEETQYCSMHLLVMTLIFSLMTFAFGFIKLYDFAFLFFSFTIISSILILYKLISLHKTSVNLLIIGVFIVSWFIYVFYAQMQNEYILSLIMLDVFPIFLVIISVIKYINRLMALREAGEEKAQ